ncbi:MAG: DsrE family protein, partial [Gammaproteobacteria bacterium]|nr:DsrE family protein [Gammaproteobacteria bacterium]
LKKGHSVRLFLMSAGVEIERLRDGNYDVVAQLEEFSVNGGKVLACGACMKARNQSESDVCPLSTMNDCVEMVEWADKTVTF